MPERQTDSITYSPEATEPATLGPLYVDMAALLSGGMPPAPKPTIGTCSDGVGLFYEGTLNTVFGDPESGKTWVVLAALTEHLHAGGRALFIDIDHNGAASLAQRLLALGAEPATLADASRFRLTSPEDATEVEQVVRDAREWQPSFVGLDSIGELLPIFGASSNSPDDFTRVHAAALKPFVSIGACVVAVDHEAKNTSSRDYGASGTAAKKRVIGGTYLRCRIVDAFTRGVGGRAELTIAKDRPGGLREHRASKDREPLAAKFTLKPRPHNPEQLSYYFDAPDPGEQAAAPDAPRPLESVIAMIDALDPPAKSANEAASRLKARRQDVYDAWKNRSHDAGNTSTENRSGNVPGTAGTPVPRSQHLGREHPEHPDATPAETGQMSQTRTPATGLAPSILAAYRAAGGDRATAEVTL